MATRLRHIAIIVPDPEKAAKFFEEAFGMTRAGTARRGIYMSDGTMNVALLKTEGDEKTGLYHFGMWVDDLDEAEKKVTQAGGSYLGRAAHLAEFILRGQVPQSRWRRVRSDASRLGWGHQGSRRKDVIAVVESRSGNPCGNALHGCSGRARA